jgi:uncharacterized protein YqgC (DUF456 family)
MTGDLGLAVLIMLVGVVGSILPLIPGPPIVWLGAFYYAWRTNFDEVGIAMLVLLAVLGIIGGTADWWLGYLGATKGGASGWATLASFVGGIVGFIVLNVPGMLLGSVGAIVLVEWLRHRDWRRVLRAGSGYLVGWLLATVVEIGVCAMMIALFFVSRSL